jgi:hypothetical protein
MADAGARRIRIDSPARRVLHIGVCRSGTPNSRGVSILASRLELAAQYMAFQQEQKFDELVDMLAEDVSMNSPMTGTISGKDALSEQLRRMPMGGGGSNSPMGNISWQQPEEDGADVKILGTGSAFGTLKITLGFDDDDKINKIDAGLA